MVTGDRDATARTIAAEVGIDRVVSEVAVTPAPATPTTEAPPAQTDGQGSVIAAPDEFELAAAAAGDQG